MFGSKEVRFSGLNIRSTPATYGNVVSISGDLRRSKFEKHILSKVELPPDELKKLENVRLSRMPAEVLIQTAKGQRCSTLQPITDSFRRG